MGVTKLGMLTPSSNTCLEPLTQEMVSGLPDLSVHYSRVPVVTIGLSAQETVQFEIDTMVASARLLADAEVDVIAWNGTAGSWLGLDHDRAIASAITEATGVPATTSTLAFFDAFAALGTKRYGLAVPYTLDVTQQIMSVYREEGLECVAEAHLDIRVNTEIGAVPGERIAELLRQVAVPGADALAVVCTNFWGGRVAPSVERERGIPVLDSVAVTLWHSLLLAGHSTAALQPWGQIFGLQTLPAARER
ncbi:maleate cis-trans isomerase family protein [Sphaerisporangium perillae]|uniref:maleate cis-trans isomerase family protein n=1 Tax=Sphaerisporangium perillae TaxID=2935860 RepID=UPI00200D8E70|nr:aspartate/glutamate racemase family protein [Sphaerisporangium perillae]